MIFDMTFYHNGEFKEIFRKDLVQIIAQQFQNIEYSCNGLREVFENEVFVVS